MTQEIRVNVSMTIKNGNLNWRNPPPGGMLIDQAVAQGPSPGYLLASAAGVDVDLSKLHSPGLTWIANIDPTYDLQVGTWDAESFDFVPFLRLKPGWQFPIPLDPIFGFEEGQTGTGTAGRGKVTLRVKGVGGPCNCSVSAFAG